MWVIKRLLLLFFLVPLVANAQTARDVAVELFTAWEDGKGLKLQWKSDPNAKRYDLYRKSSSGWVLLDTFKPSVLSYTDTTMKKGMVREYRVAKWHTKYTTFQGNGYLLAGYEVPVRSLGKVLVAIDSSYTKALSVEIAEYLDQLTREGWTPVRKSFLRSDTVTRVKSWFESEYKKDTAGVKAILLLGRIPVPYSGNFRPDAHPEHTGAWPADLYYGSFTIQWLDASVNNTSAARSNNHNTVGDGKFDLSRYNTSLTLPSAAQKVELPVGRIDLYNMDGFSVNDTLLVKRYLRKNLAFRRGQFKPMNRGLIDDNFGYFNTEAFASGGFRNFSVHSADSVFERDYLTEMRKNSYLCSYGCGSGIYTAASGVASSGDFVSDSLLNPFTLTFGSYYGDWDNQDNFLRAPLASRGWGLVSVWSGRPYWLMHTTALGEPLFSAVLRTYNSYPDYNTASQYSGVHVALMGDPTLKVYPVSQINNVKVISTCSHALKSFIRWDATGDNADSIFIEIQKNGSWQKLAVAGSSDTAFRLDFDTGTYLISVRPKKLMKSASGTWWDLGAREIRKFRVNPLPTAAVSFSQSSYCLGDSVVIRDTDTKLPAKKSWQWAVGNKMLVKDQTGTWGGRLYSVGSNDVFLTVISDSGCSSSYVDSLRVNANSQPTILGDSEYCKGQNFTLSLDVKNSNSIKSKRWWLDNSLVDTTSKYTGAAGSAGMYQVVLEIIDNNGCLGYDTFEFRSKRIPLKPILTVLQSARFRGDTISLRATSNLDLTRWNYEASGLGVLRQDSVFTAIIPQGSNSYGFKAWAVAEWEGCSSDTALWSAMFEFNNLVKTAFEGDCLVKRLGAGVFQVEIYGNSAAKTLEVRSLTGAKWSETYTLTAQGKALQTTIYTLNRMDVGVLVLLIKDFSGNVIGTKKIF